MVGGRALVVASGADVERLATASPAVLTVCADAGLDAALAAGIRVDLVIGDLDSASAAALDAAREVGTEIVVHAVAKDDTDLELALGAAVARAVDSIEVHLGSGGRLDHQLANLLVLASPRWASVAVSAVVGGDRVWVVREPMAVPLEPGDPLALHAVGGAAEGVSTTGLAFELSDERLDALVGRGVANQVVSAGPVVGCRAGVLLAINSPTP